MEWGYCDYGLEGIASSVSICLQWSENIITDHVRGYNGR